MSDTSPIPSTTAFPTFTLPYSWPSNIAQPGTQFFDLAVEVKYKDPIVEEWDLTLEQDLGKGVGLRVSYDGNHGYNIPTVVNADQPTSKQRGLQRPLHPGHHSIPADVVHRHDGTISGFANYNAGTISVNKRSANFQFEVSYTYTRDLSNVNGAPIASASITPTNSAIL